MHVRFNNDSFEFQVHVRVSGSAVARKSVSSKCIVRISDYANAFDGALL
jgi:hypothetical protein